MTWELKRFDHLEPLTRGQRSHERQGTWTSVGPEYHGSGGAEVLAN